MTASDPSPAGTGGTPAEPFAPGRDPLSDPREEVARLTAELERSEHRRRVAEQTLASVARSTAAELNELRGRLSAEPSPPAAMQEGGTPQPPARRSGRRVRRVALGVIATAGLLVAVDGALTIFWQDPVTKIAQDRAQSKLKGDLKSLDAQVAAAPKVARESTASRMRRLAISVLEKRKDGQALGRLEIPRIGLNTVLVKGTAHDDLAKGPGYYKGTMLPGIDGTVGIAGHRTTYGAPFRHIDELKPGSRVIVRMPYGKFTYKVTRTQIVSPNDAEVLRSRAGSDRVVLTACHPLYSAAQRMVVTAELADTKPTTASV